MHLSPTSKLGYLSFNNSNVPCKNANISTPINATDIKIFPVQ